MDVNDLLNSHCREYPKGSEPLSASDIQLRLPLTPGWELVESGGELRFSERMADFPAVIDFVNKVAALAEEEQHHPDLHVTGYRNLRIDLATHSIGGLTDNDFIMAAKINQMRGQA